LPRSTRSCTGWPSASFNNLLTVILSWSELILFRDLTRQLLVFSRDQPAALRLLDLNEVLSRVGKLLRRLVGDQIELRVHPGAGLGPVRADPNS